MVSATLRAHMELDEIKYSTSDGVATITLDRPNVLNAISARPGGTRDQILAAIESAENDPDVGCVIINGAGRAFCGGGDLTGARRRETLDEHAEFLRTANAFHERLTASKVPTIAVVHGYCLGAGVLLATACDFVLAGDDATFGFPEGRLGLVGAAALTPRLGRQWAKFMIMTGENVDAATARSLGLVLTVEPVDELQARANELAQRIARMPRESVMLNRRAIDAAADAAGESEARTVAVERDAETLLASPRATAPDGRAFRDILGAEGMSGLKTAQAAQYTRPWLRSTPAEHQPSGPWRIRATDGTDSVVTITGLGFRAFRAHTDGAEIERGLTTMTGHDLPTDGVLIRVHWSSVNYKDGLASVPGGQVSRITPIVPGIDLAGVLVEDAPGMPAGTEVLAHGYGIGVSRHGGYADYARVPADWLVPVPDGMTMRDTMVVGTAGFTAALSVIALEQHGVTPDRGPILVTGATGGVGSTAVDILSNLGYEVVASTGKPDAAGWLADLGAAAIIDRSVLSEAGKRPLESTEYAGAVDCVGGITLGNVLKRIQHGGAVAASGLTGGPELSTTVMPFILRGVNLLGIDSVEMPMDRRRAAWARIGTDLKPSNLATIGHDVTLDQLDQVLTDILAGKAQGRSVVDLRP